jgi:hypothetical protein
VVTPPQRAQPAVEPDTARRYLFIHIMRTGGATFTRQLERNFPAGELYPDPRQDTDTHQANIEVDYLLGLPRERIDQIRVFTGHFPFFVSELIPECQPLTMTILRHPVQRSISFLREKRRKVDNVLSLEELYDFPGLRQSLLGNFQVRQFAMTAGDNMIRGIDPLEIDEERLALAKENLAKVDVLGLHERYEEFMDDVMQRFGWLRHPIGNWHVSEAIEVPKALESRIADDNAWDIAFYEHAVEMYDERRGTRIAP